MLCIKILRDSTVIGAEAHEFPVYVHHPYYSNIPLRCEEELAQGILSLDQSEYWYDWNEEIKSDSPYGDGHCYNDAFYDYLGKVSKTLNSKLNYDSENGMFCVYTDDIRIADEVAYKLSQLYKDEDKMIELIKDTKANYGYVFDVHI